MAEMTIADASGGVLLRVDLTTREKLIVGGRSTCDVQLKGTEVAGHHALIFREIDQWKIIALTTRYGIWMNDQPIRNAILQEDTPLRIGEAFLWFFDLPSSQATALPMPGQMNVKERVLLRGEYIEQLWRKGKFRVAGSSGSSRRLEALV